MRGVPRRGEWQEDRWCEIPWWGTASALAAPVVLLAGTAAATRVQPPGFDALGNTMSALAGQGANDRWIMTATFVVVAACDIVTALALRPAPRAGRAVLAAAGLGGMMVAAFPERLGGSLIHACWAGVAFGALILWPVLARRRGPGVPWGLRPGTVFAVAAALAALTAWFAAEELFRGADMGLAERAAGVAQTAWPLFVVLSCRRARPGGLPGAVPADGAPGGSVLSRLIGLITATSGHAGPQPADRADQ